MVELSKKYLKGAYKVGRKRLSYFLSDIQKGLLCDTVKKPYDLLWVNPLDIKMRKTNCHQTDLNIFRRIKGEALQLYDLELGAFDPRRNTGLILEGSWDLKRKLYEGKLLQTSYKLRFRKGAAWEETPYFKKGAEILRKGGTLYGCNTISEFKSVRLAYIEQLYNNMKRRGYRTQKSMARDTKSKGVYHEITVDIGRNGELIYNNATGNNRLALAKVLKLGKVPVLVVVRHRDWELLKKEIRCNKATGIDKSIVQKVSSHPDFCTL